MENKEELNYEEKFKTFEENNNKFINEINILKQQLKDVTERLNKQILQEGFEDKSGKDFKIK